MEFWEGDTSSFELFDKGKEEKRVEIRSPSLGTVVDPNCKDTIDTCWKMPETNCKAPYDEWAKQYCPNRCGYCIGPSTPIPPCVDVLPNCASYEKSVCTDTNYRTWAAENCRAYCRMYLCTPAQIETLDRMTTTIAPENCVDKVDCRQYGTNACSKQFEAWSHDNCPKHCRYCDGVPTPPPVCEDKIPNCNQYPNSTCTTPDYKLWVDDNCKKFCGRCTAANAIVYTPPTPAPPAPGKRNRVGLREARPKRQFHASHHHPVDCWDGNNSADPKCNTTTDGSVSTQTTAPLRVTSESSGTEFLTIFHPHPITTDWDGKPEITVTVPGSKVTPSHHSSFNSTTPSSPINASVSTTSDTSTTPSTTSSMHTTPSSISSTTTSVGVIPSITPSTTTSSEATPSATLSTTTSIEATSSLTSSSSTTKIEVTTFTTLSTTTSSEATPSTTLSTTMSSEATPSTTLLATTSIEATPSSALLTTPSIEASSTTTINDNSNCGDTFIINDSCK
ncbi:hypothetical protein DPMN_067267 [Dreissena polymorpha]|uniref:ShKT domain-containing protein n=1 Tax=Dreissena polymorpha TaxID=45954 RepID=A0A9D3Z0G2_DREPO|nr:hypothetical protein DPMN_067267 [Dreissena polymorpha]